MALETLAKRIDVHNVFSRLTPRHSTLKPLESCLSAPRVDIKELENCFEITAELPGVSKADLHIVVHDGVLAITAETNRENETESEGRLIQHERRSGSLVRSFKLGNLTLKESDIDSDFSDGLLTLCVPRDIRPGVQ